MTNLLKTACVVLVFCVATAITLPAQTFTTSFNDTDGAYPFAGLVQDTNGNFYGTTYNGGAALSGVVFKITANGTLTTVYSFCPTSACTTGALPRAGLIQHTNGNLYGTALSGGVSNRGTVFKVAPNGALTTLYSFCNLASCMDGAQPFAPLLQASNGSLYGTAESGGQYGFGAIFAITPTGTLTTLYSFCPATGCSDGAGPNAGFVQASNGAFYSTTPGGGANKNSSCAVEGCGTVFKFVGSAVTPLYNFCAKTNCTDGQTPNPGLILASDGNFYGTTASGGANNLGSVFKMTPSGSLTTLYSFCPLTGCVDGESPTAGVIQASDGNFYGTTSSGGIGFGTIFKITAAGAFTSLYSFNDTDGGGPYAGLLQGTNGNLYGTTFQDGALGYGVVFSLSEGLAAFVETRPTSGKVGAAVAILGTNLTGATAVTFNGTAATFKVFSSSEITTTVPTGATTGTVKVTTPTRTLKSNVAFRVP